VIVLDLNDRRWSDFVRSCAQASPFHHPAWAGLLAECYRYPALVLALTDAAGEIVAGLPVLDVSGPLAGRRWVSLPFTDYCPPLVKGHPPPNLSAALSCLARSRQLDELEVRASLTGRDWRYTHQVGVRHTLALSTSPNELHRQFSKMHQRNIRKAESAGVQIRRGHSACDMQMFYRLHLLTRRRLGVPIQPLRFFNLLTDKFLSRGLGFILSAHLHGVPIAAAVFLVRNGEMIYKFGASDPRFWEHRPNNLLFWSAIRWGCENGFRTLDWGRTDTEDLGLRRFKSGWGAREEPLTYARIARRIPKVESGRLRSVMGVVIRRSPPWVCRATGELLYRYAV
jgi:CelD/BcsL family acetyltransferase involved in cellulose biosynthesis